MAVKRRADFGDGALHALHGALVDPLAEALATRSVSQPTGSVSTDAVRPLVAGCAAGQDRGGQRTAARFGQQLGAVLRAGAGAIAQRTQVSIAARRNTS